MEIPAANDSFTGPQRLGSQELVHPLFSPPQSDVISKQAVPPLGDRTGTFFAIHRPSDFISALTPLTEIPQFVCDVVPVTSTLASHNLLLGTGSISKVFSVLPRTMFVKLELSAASVATTVRWCLPNEVEGIFSTHK